MDGSQTIVVRIRKELDIKDHPTFQCSTLLPIIQSESFRFPGESVRNLFISWWSPQKDEVLAILSACPSVQNLSLAPVGPGALFHLVEHLPLRELYCHVGHHFGPQRQIDFTHQLFAKITHLEVYDASEDVSADPERWKQLSLIPHLTHLGLNNAGLIDAWLALLRTCKSLRVLVVLDPGGRPLLRTVIDEHRELVKDPRLVLVDPGELSSLDWRNGAHRGIEDFIAKRRSGEINALRYYDQEPDGV
ncbi:hypothetical protein B0H14DRAFT_3142393 [Mycena olivaceomarginata]|nr:hypothetical protein B0H14DRAFT_3142393 [Mycena olivaceomarginata]